MKYILLICDGMADLPSEKGTPLEYANTPNFDAIAEKGIVGLMDPLAPGKRPGSDTAHLSILGYDLSDYKGRGALEAMGAGIKLEPGDVAFRANIATIDENFVIKDRRAGRITEDVNELVKAVNSIELPVEFSFHHTIEHRGVLVLKNCSAKVSETDPHEDGVKVLESKAIDDSPEAVETADAVNEFTKKVYEVLKGLELNKDRELPANQILLRGASECAEVKSFEEKYGLKGACISAVSLVKGVAIQAGMDLLDVEGMTGNAETNIKGKFETALNALKDYDFVLINIKAPDLFGHDGDFEGKAKMIEKIDSFIPVLTDGLGENTLAVTADHATPVSVEDHSGDPVPVVIFGAGVKADGVTKFGEKYCKEGGLGRILGTKFMPTLLKQSESKV